MTLRPISRIARPLAAVAVVAALAGCSQSSLLNGKDGYPAASGGEHGAAAPVTASATHDPSASATTSSVDAADAAFVSGMIPHHAQAVKMSEMALAKPGVSAAVKKLATSIQTSQSAEIKAMESWLTTNKAPKADAHAGHGAMAGMVSDADMTTLSQATGAAFDKKWLTLMIAHHEGAVTSATNILKTTKKADVTMMAKSIATSQKAEIATMKKLLG